MYQKPWDTYQVDLLVYKGMVDKLKGIKSVSQSSHDAP